MAEMHGGENVAEMNGGENVAEMHGGESAAEMQGKETRGAKRKDADRKKVKIILFYFALSSHNSIFASNYKIMTK
ncbi:MAG: hypothetical protein K6F89_04925 [Prevotella sp.]|nr:hypothetical protein [Prevotella sp.]